jgi:CheY-like chemotaxis protein
MTAPVLLVHDDIALIASVRRLLTRVGHEVVLATSAADALVAFGHHRPALVILSPDIERGRGNLVLDELQHDPGHPLRLVLLGRDLPGVEAPVVPLPLDGKQLLDTVDEVLRVHAAQGEAVSAPAHQEDAASAEETERIRRAADAVFEATHREIEAEAVASVSAALDAAWTREVDWSTPPAREALDAEVDDFEREVLEAAVETVHESVETAGAESVGAAALTLHRPATRDAPKPPRIKSGAVNDRPSSSMKRDPGDRLAPSGTVSLEQLARVVVRVVEEPGPARLDLRADGALRTLWFEGAALVAADSVLPHESLTERARRDGLIDSRQHSELRLMRGVSAAQLLQLLKDRGYIREHEVVPLVQRHTENIALEAFGEARSEYRLTAERPGAGTVSAAGTRRPVEIVLEGLRRSLDGAERLAALGGLTAVPSFVRGAESRVSGLVLAEREDRFLSLVDGEATVEQVLLASGLRQDSALKLLAALAALGWVEVRPPDVEPQPAPPPALELERLDSKFREVQEADYFAILGISRAAGTDEVQRAYDRLSTEFAALKYAGHPDANIHHRVREIQAALSEAAHVLRDDRLRLSYSRHLVD